MPIVPALRRLKQKDHLGPGVTDQPRQYRKTKCQQPTSKTKREEQISLPLSSSSTFAKYKSSSVYYERPISSNF
jgi:hypothetical protein